MNRSELINHIARTVTEKECSSFAIVGPARSGKTTFLRQLTASLCARSSKVVVHGPIAADAFADIGAFRARFLGWLEQEELLCRQPDLELCRMAASEALFWEQVGACLDLSIKRVVVILIDGVDTNGTGSEHLYQLFGSLRKFCNEWHNSELSVHFVSCGNWSRAQVNSIFKQHEASRPFVRDETLFALPDLTTEETRTWLQTVLGRKVRDLHADYLWELTRGDTATVNLILSSAGPRPLDCEGIYAAAEAVLLSEEYCDKLRSQVAKLSESGRRQLTDLLAGKFVDGRRSGEAGEQLLLAGLAREDCVGDLKVLRLKNWVIESGLRHHWSSLTDLAEGNIYTDYEEFVPPIGCLNREAYHVICEIENLLRNFAIERLHLYAEGNHPLTIIPYAGNAKYDHDNEYDSAAEWRKRTIEKGYVSTHSATASFSATPQVQAWIKHLHNRREDPLAAWFSTLDTDLETFKAIRDAVNHNQIIAEESYDTLLRLREAVYRALLRERVS